VSDYVLSSDAELDLDDIWEYVAGDSIDAADRWIGKLFDAFDAITQTPGIGHKRDDLTPYPVLFWPVGAYLIILPCRTATGGDCGGDSGGTRHTLVSAPASALSCLNSRTTLAEANRLQVAMLTWHG